MLTYDVRINYIGSFRRPANRDHACHLMVEQPFQRTTLVSDTSPSVENRACDADSVRDSCQPLHVWRVLGHAYLDRYEHLA